MITQVRESLHEPFYASAAVAAGKESLERRQLRPKTASILPESNLSKSCSPIFVLLSYLYIILRNKYLGIVLINLFRMLSLSYYPYSL